jgi:hypothetical protein
LDKFFNEIKWLHLVYHIFLPSSRAGSYFLLDQKVRQKIKKKRCSPAFGPTRTPPFFRAIAHGVNQPARTISLLLNAS